MTVSKTMPVRMMRMVMIMKKDDIKENDDANDNDDDNEERWRLIGQTWV